MTGLEEAAAVGGLIGSLGGIIGGVIMPIVLTRLKHARLEREARDIRLDGMFARLEDMFRHLDECLESKTNDLRSQINGVHLEVAKEYAPKSDLRGLEVNLRNEIDIAGRMTKLEDVLRGKRQ